MGADDWSVALFDTVSGGAGHVIQIEAEPDQVLLAALRSRRVTTCECGPETSCYGCLRSYSNQRDHDELSRGAAEQILQSALGQHRRHRARMDAPTRRPPRRPTHCRLTGMGPTQPRSRGACLLEHLPCRSGCARPELGAESAGGIPIPVSWPDRLLAADLGLQEEDERDLKAEGWTVHVARARSSPGRSYCRKSVLPQAATSSRFFRTRWRRL